MNSTKPSARSTDTGAPGRSRGGQSHPLAVAPPSRFIKPHLITVPTHKRHDACQGAMRASADFATVRRHGEASKETAYIIPGLSATSAVYHIKGTPAKLVGIVDNAPDEKTALDWAIEEDQVPPNERGR